MKSPDYRLNVQEEGRDAVYCGQRMLQKKDVKVTGFLYTFFFLLFLVLIGNIKNSLSTPNNL